MRVSRLRTVWQERKTCRAMSRFASPSATKEMILLTADVDRTWGMYELLNTLVQSLAPWLLLLEAQELSRPDPQAPWRRGKPFVSPREEQVLMMVDLGRTNSQIAEELGYSEATIRADLLRLSKLLDVRGRHDVVRRARELGLYPE